MCRRLAVDRSKQFLQNIVIRGVGGGGGGDGYAWGWCCDSSRNGSDQWGFHGLGKVAFSKEILTSYRNT